MPALLDVADAQGMPFVTRSGTALLAGDRPFSFAGVNAYYLMESAARGDSAVVDRVFTTAADLGCSVVRTWAFSDSPDSLNPAVIQYRPGVLNERALRALDYVVHRAGLHGIRLLLPFVNSWDEYGGMNQYARWRSEEADAALHLRGARYSREQQQMVVSGQRGQGYRVAVSEAFGHDDFYTDTTIRRWYGNYVAAIVGRVNSYTGVRYADDPAILGWELANEPRSSDRTTVTITQWVDAMSHVVKSIDDRHLVGTGEEGFDGGGTMYTMGAYNNQTWLFNGSAGLSFSANVRVATIDFAGVHLYPESWGFSYGGGSEWIRDHQRIASAAGKPFLVGEFGARAWKAPAYDSWLTTVLLEGGAGALVWQLLDASRTDPEGLGFRCPGDELVCSVLQRSAAQFNQKSRNGSIPVPDRALLLQNYPNPFNGITTISYALPFDADVTLRIYTATGQLVSAVAEGFRSAGTWKELFDARLLASGAYVCRLSARGTGATAGSFTGTKKLLRLR